MRYQRHHPLGTASRGSILGATLILMIFLLGAALPLLMLVGIENHRVNHHEDHVLARYRAEGALLEGVQAVRQFYTTQASADLWELVEEGDVGYIIAEDESSPTMGAGTTYSAHITKQRYGAYEEFTNWITGRAVEGRRTVELRVPTWNMKMGLYSMWAHGTDEYDAADVNKGNRSGNITWTPGDYCLGHAYAAGSMNILAGTPKATFYRRCEAAGNISNIQNGIFRQEGQPRARIAPYRLNYKTGFWSNAEAKANPAQGGIKLPGGYDYVIDLDEISAAIGRNQPTLTIKRRAHRSDSAVSIDGDVNKIKSMEGGKTSITQTSKWTATTEWQDSDWMQYWDEVTINLPTKEQWNGVIFAGDVNDQGSVSSNNYLSSILLRGTAQYKPTSVICTDDCYFIGNVYGGTSEGDFSRKPGAWNPGTGTACPVSVCAKDEMEWSIVQPRNAETMCGMFSQYGRYYTEIKDYVGSNPNLLWRMPQAPEWDFDYDFQIDPDTSLWQNTFRERDAKNVLEFGRGPRTLSYLGRQYTADWYEQGPWTQRTGGPWVGAGEYDNTVFWHYPAYVGNGGYNSLAYDVNPALADPTTQPPIMPVITNSFQFGAILEVQPGLDTWS